MGKLIQALELLVLLMILALLIHLYRDHECPSAKSNRQNEIWELKRVGSDGKAYYFSMSDTIPGFPHDLKNYFKIPDSISRSPETTPHISLFQGDPMHLHGLLSLENFSVTGDDSLIAVLGIVDVNGNTNNVLKITPGNIMIQTTLAGDTTGGSTYFFTTNGITFKRDYSNSKSTYTLTNNTGLEGQVLALNASADSAKWQYPIQKISRSGLHTYSSVSLARSAGLVSGDVFILETTMCQSPIKILAFVP